MYIMYSLDVLYTYMHTVQGTKYGWMMYTNYVNEMVGRRPKV